MRKPYPTDYEALKDYCQNEKETLLIETLLKERSQMRTAKILGISSSTVLRILENMRERQKTPIAMVGNFNNPTKTPLTIKKISAYGDFETGEVTKGWVKYDVDAQAQLEQILKAVKSTVESYKPLPKIPAPKSTQKDIITIYPMGDPHIGMYAWSGETGEDFDCDIAEKNLREAMQYLVGKSPESETAVILNLGDFFHGDNSSNTTTKGTAVDIDSRWGRVYQIGMTLMIDCVNLALEKHKKVIVRNNIGNHDKHTSQALSIAMQHIFSNNPRVEIADASNPFFMHEFGKNLIFSTHGDGLKPKQAQGFVSNAYSDIWGRTEHRLALFGHFHHEDRKEENGLIVEIFNTLAASDAWHHASGYRSKRNMKSIVLHKEEGEVERYTFNLSRRLLHG